MRYRLCGEGLLVDVPSDSVQERIQDIEARLVREQQREGEEEVSEMKRREMERDGCSVIEVEREGGSVG